MRTIDIESIAATPGGSARFEGESAGSSVSFFVVRVLPGEGAVKHRHPYDETFVLLDGQIEAIVDGEKRMLRSGTIAVIPAMAWHEFTNRGSARASMVNIHPSPRIIQENWSDLTRDAQTEAGHRLIT
jgi:quercetin dioxygenase-like cupin family protein